MCRRHWQHSACRRRRKTPILRQRLALEFASLFIRSIWSEAWHFGVADTRPPMTCASRLWAANCMSASLRDAGHGDCGTA
jgi:hypothetical protein